MDAPCKNCRDRKVGCHGTCEKYAYYDRLRKTILKRIADENRKNDDLWRTSRHSKRRK